MITLGSLEGLAIPTVVIVCVAIPIILNVAEPPPSPAELVTITSPSTSTVPASILVEAFPARVRLPFTVNVDPDVIV